MWLAFLSILVFAGLIITGLWQLNWAKSRKYPIKLLATGFLVVVIGAVLLGTSGFASSLIERSCKLETLAKLFGGDCKTYKDWSEFTSRLLEIGFASLGAGLMSLAFDIKTNDDLDAVRKAARDRLNVIRLRKDEWKAARDRLGQELDSLTPAEKVNRYESLIAEDAEIFDELYDAEEELEKWL